MHASREGTELPREKRKIYDQRKKAAHTLSKPETLSTKPLSQRINVSS